MVIIMKRTIWLVLTIIMILTIISCTAKDVSENEEITASQTLPDNWCGTPDPITTTDSATTTPNTTTVPTTTTTLNTTTVPVTTTNAVTTTTAPINTTSAVTTTTTPTTTTVPTTTTPNTTPPLDPIPSPEYNYTEQDYKEPNVWYNFEERLWKYFYVERVGINGKLNEALIKPSKYNSQSKKWLPEVDGVDLFDWQQKNDTNRAYLSAVDDISAILAFVAPSDGCYAFEVAVSSSEPGEGSDGSYFYIFTNQKCIYSLKITESDSYDTQFTVSLKAGQCVYFVDDPYFRAYGDSKLEISAHVTQLSDVYIDNENAWSFGQAYTNDSLTQGTNGWYAGYVSNDAKVDKSSFEGDILSWMTQGFVFGMIAHEPSNDPDKRAIVLWEAQETGKYSAQISLWANAYLPSDKVSVSFWVNGEKITERYITATQWLNCTMEIELEKGGTFAVVIDHLDDAASDHVEALAVVIS